MQLLNWESWSHSTQIKFKWLTPALWTQELVLLLSLYIPLKNIVQYCHPYTQGSFSPDCSHLWFHDGGTFCQMLSELGVPLYLKEYLVRLIWDDNTFSLNTSRTPTHLTQANFHLWIPLNVLAKVASHSKAWMLLLACKSLWIKASGM